MQIERPDLHLPVHTALTLCPASRKRRDVLFENRLVLPPRSCPVEPNPVLRGAVSNPPHWGRTPPPRVPMPCSPLQSLPGGISLPTTKQRRNTWLGWFAAEAHPSAWPASVLPGPDETLKEERRRGGRPPRSSPHGAHLPVAALPCVSKRRPGEFPDSPPFLSPTASDLSLPLIWANGYWLWVSIDFPLI